MSKLKKKLLGDITNNFDKLRVPLSSRERENLEKKYRYYGAQGIIDYVDNYIFDGEYILVAEDGENLKSQKANVCNLVKGKFWVNNHAHILQAKDNHDIRYLYYLLNLTNFTPYISGSAQPKLTQDSLNKIELNIFDLSTQQKIASILSSLDAKIELNNLINTELEAMAKTLYDYWFVQFDFPNAEGKPYKSSGGKMVWSEELKREIPEGWKIGNILEVAELLGGGTPNTKQTEYWGGDIPFFTPKDVETGVFVVTTLQSITELGLQNCSSKLFPKGTIFITARGTVGNINIASQNMAMNQSCYAFQGKNDIDYSFLYLFVSDVVLQLKAKANGSVFDAIVSNDIKSTTSAIPPNEVIQMFTKLGNSVFEKTLSNKQENQQLAHLRDWLLPMLMNGQVVVE